MKFHEAMKSAGETMQQGETLRRSFVPPRPAPPDDRRQIAATLAAGMIAASGQPYTVDAALKVWREVLEKLEKS